jgi:hypothetical protein
MAYSPVNLSNVATDGTATPQLRPAFRAGTGDDQHRYRFLLIPGLRLRSVTTLLTWGNVIGYASLPK